MCASREEEHELLSGRVTCYEQRVYVKIETSSGNTVPKILAALREVCGDDTLDHSSV